MQGTRAISDEDKMKIICRNGLGGTTNIPDTLRKLFDGFCH